MSLLKRLQFTHLAWEFTEVLPGGFERNRPKWQGYKLPILGPVPDQGANTSPREGARIRGPFIYAVCDAADNILYLGKSQEKRITQRWIRPDRISGRHYWSHGTTGTPSPNCPKTIERIAAHIISCKGSIRVLFAGLVGLRAAVRDHMAGIGGDTGEFDGLTDESFVAELEALLLRELQPPWNSSQPPVKETFKRGARYWEVA